MSNNEIRDMMAEVMIKIDEARTDGNGEDCAKLRSEWFRLKKLLEEVEK